VHAQLDGTALRVKLRGRVGHLESGTTTVDGRRVTVGDTTAVTVSDIDTVAGTVTVKLAGRSSGSGGARRRRNRRRAA
jgi:microcystin degradation protein MlrC